MICDVVAQRGEGHEFASQQLPVRFHRPQGVGVPAVVQAGVSLFTGPTDGLIPGPQPDDRVPKGNDPDEFFVLPITHQKPGSSPVASGDRNTPAQ